MGSTYRNLKIHHLLREGAHLIVEAELVLPDLVRREHEVTLSLFCPIQYNLLAGAYHRVVDVERAAGLDLTIRMISPKSRNGRTCAQVPNSTLRDRQSERIQQRLGRTYCEVESHLRPLVLDTGEETRLLIGVQLVR